MSEMLERVARALHYKLASDPDWDDAPLVPEMDPDGDISRQECFDLARVLISAMRNPTQEMCRVGRETGQFENEHVHSRDDQSKIVWQEMIDEALK